MSPGAHWIGSWMDSRAGLDVVVKEKKKYIYIYIYIYIYMLSVTLQNDELHSLYSSPNIVRVIK
jgi:hypothetical protein